MLVQAFLLVKCRTNATNPMQEIIAECRSAFECFLLVNSAFTMSNPFASLNPVINPADFNPPAGTIFDLIEIWGENIVSAEDLAANHGVREVPVLYVSGHNIDLIQQLLPGGSEIECLPKFCNRKLKYRQTDQISNALHGYHRFILKLLTSGVSIRYRHRKGGTLAHFAVKNSLYTLVSVLQKCDVNLNAPRKDGLVPLAMAVKRKNKHLVRVLIEKGANVNENRGDIPTLFSEVAVDIKTSPKEDWTALHEAAFGGSETMVELLLDGGANIDAKATDVTGFGSVTPLLVALKERQWHAAIVLIKRGASLEPVNKGRNALFYAVERSCSEIVDLIIGRGLDVNDTYNKYSLHLALRKPFIPLNIAIIRKLLTHGFTISPANASMPGLLMCAILENCTDIAQKILEAGAYPNQSLSIEEKSLYPVIFNACKVILDENAASQSGGSALITPMTVAVVSQNVDAAKLLLDHNVSVYGRADFLRCALEAHHHDMINLLVENGCPVSPCDGKSPMGFAFRNACETCVDVLMKHGAPFEYRQINLDRVYLSEDETDYTSVTFFAAYLHRGLTKPTPRAEKSVAVFLQNIVDELYTECRHSELGDGDDSDFSFERECVEVILVKILARHLVKLAACDRATVVIPDKVRRLFKVKNFERICRTELERMRGKTIGETGVSVLEFLMKSTTSLAARLKNRTIREVMNDSSILDDLPNYKKIVKHRVRQATWRSEFIARGVEGLNKLFIRLPRLPYEVEEDIVLHLSNQDILSLELCFKSR